MARRSKIYHQTLQTTLKPATGPNWCAFGQTWISFFELAVLLVADINPCLSKGAFVLPVTVLEKNRTCHGSRHFCASTWGLFGQYTHAEVFKITWSQLTMNHWESFQMTHWNIHLLMWGYHHLTATKSHGLIHLEPRLPQNVHISPVGWPVNS